MGQIVQKVTAAVNKLISYLRPFTIPVLLVILFIFIQAMAELALPTLMSDVVNNGMMKGDTNYILTYGGWMLLVALASTLFSFSGAFFSARVALGVGKNLRNDVFERVVHSSLLDFDQIGTASLITRTTNDIVQVQTALVMMLRFVVFSPVMSIGGIIMAVSRDRELTMILLVAIPVMLAFMALISKTVMPAFKAMQKKLDRLNMVLRENLTGIRVIRAFNKLQHEHDRFRGANRDLTNTAIYVNKVMAVMHPMVMLIMNLTSVAITWFGGIRIAQGDMLIGDMMAFIQYAMQIMFSFIMVAMMFVMLPRAQASAERINEVLNSATSAGDDWPRGTAKLTNNGALVPIISGTGGTAVEFWDVCFYYPGAEEPALKHVSFQARSGETTAVIGGTGSGKTTLINLILRFYDATEGQILVHGQDVLHQPAEALRDRIGYVSQTVVLFTGTIADNIRYGKQDATLEEIQRAAKIAQADQFIMEKPEGYDAEIAQGGTNVSGGQKQRLSIARAVIKKPELYLFDDSFSALDYKTDAKLRAALKQETSQAAVLIVAQRVSTVLDADKILVMDEGELVGSGRHQELMKNCQVYREIVTSQLSEEEISAYEQS